MPTRKKDIAVGHNLGSDTQQTGYKNFPSTDNEQRNSLQKQTKKLFPLHTESAKAIVHNIDATCLVDNQRETERYSIESLSCLKTIKIEIT